MSEAVRKIKRVLEVNISGISGVFLKAIKKICAAATGLPGGNGVKFV
jgi:hypothetical protein